MTTGSPGLKPVTSGPYSRDLPGGLRPDASGILRLAKAMPRQPQTSMWLSATALTRICTSPAPGGRRGGSLGQFELAVGDKSERTHGGRVSGKHQWVGSAKPGHHAGSRPRTRETFWPPKPKELDSAWRKFGVARHVGHDVERNAPDREHGS